MALALASHHQTIAHNAPMAATTLQQGLSAQTAASNATLEHTPHKGHQNASPALEGSTLQSVQQNAPYVQQAPTLHTQEQPARLFVSHAQ